MTDAATSSITLSAHAKLNISLAVGPLQPDGYHLIDSLMAPLELADVVTLSPSPAGISLRVSGPTAGQTPADRSNLVWRAAELLARAAGREPNVAISVEKNIPVGGGLAGGSTDAAAVLVGLNRLWGLDWPVERLIGLGAELGSDVPFCVGGRAAWVRGRGQIVQPIAEPLPPLWVLLIMPGLFVSTAQVYARLDEIRAEDTPVRQRKHALAGLEFYNQLEGPALEVCPALDGLVEILERHTGVPRLLVAGSGSTLFVPFDNPAEATAWKQRVDTGVVSATRLLPGACRTMVSAVLGDASSCRQRDG